MRVNLNNRYILKGRTWVVCGQPPWGDVSAVGDSEAEAIDNAIAIEPALDGSPVWVQHVTARELVEGRRCELAWVWQGSRELPCDGCGNQTRSIMLPPRGNWIVPVCSVCRSLELLVAEPLIGVGRA